MKDKEMLDRISELTEKIAELPKGYISEKRVGGKTYFYHQWSQDGVKQSRYLRDSEVRYLAEQIEKRNELKSELSDIKASYGRRALSGEDYILMHQNIPVCKIEIDVDTGNIVKAGSLLSEEHLPVGVPVVNGRAERTALNEWWIRRSIPDSRPGMKEALENLNITSVKALLTRSNGLSLSDQYWICPEGSDLNWESINFFKNDFSEDIGDILFGMGKGGKRIDFSSPDITSDGNLKKRWKIISGGRYLIKGGSNPYRQEPLNEVIATEIMKRLGVECAEYVLFWNESAPYCAAKDFLDENTELVSAGSIIKILKRDNKTSLFDHTLSCLKGLGIPGAREFLDRMIVIDYLILNEDRHLSNFGAIRDARTLEWLGMAPIFDSGSSLGFDKTPQMMRVGSEITCKPFKKTHEEQLKLVSDFRWIDFVKLDEIPGIIGSVLRDEKAAGYMDEPRILAICELAQERVNRLKDFVKERIDG